MLLQDKIKHLRLTEGLVRGLGREMTKAEVLRAMETEMGQSVSHAYMCQLESGVRDHMSPGTRSLLATFFKVHPGYLVSDPPDYQEELAAPMFLAETAAVTAAGPGPSLSGNPTQAAAPAGKDFTAKRLLQRVLEQDDPEVYLHLMERLLDHPALAKQLHDVLKDLS